MNRFRVLLVVAAVVVVAALSGCVVFVKGTTVATQENVIGGMRLSAQICGSPSPVPPAHPGCDDADVEGGDAAGKNNVPTGNEPETYQLLAGYRVPVGSEGPAEFATSGAGAVTLRRSDSYTSELQRLAPAPAGSHWVGYISDPFEYDGDANQTVEGNRLTLAPVFSLPPGPDGGPYQGPFRYRIVVGGRRPNDAAEAAEPVACEPALDVANNGETTCVDAPPPDVVGTDLQAPTRDLGFVVGSEPAVLRLGSPVAVNFVARYAGEASPEATFALSASTNVPGGKATPAAASFTPATNSDTPLPVSVDVPPTTPAGTYEVTLTASLPNGLTRSGTRQFVYQPQPQPQPQPPKPKAPRVSLAVVKGQTVRSLLKRGLRVRVRIDQAGTVAARLLRRKRTLGTKAVRFPAAGTRTITVKLSRKARKPRSHKALLKPRRLALTLRLTATNAAGEATTSRRSVKLKR